MVHSTNGKIEDGLFLLYQHDGDSEIHEQKNELWHNAVTQRCPAWEDPLLLSTLCPALLTMTIFTAWGAGRWFRLTKWESCGSKIIKNPGISFPSWVFCAKELFWIILKVIEHADFAHDAVIDDCHGLWSETHRGQELYSTSASYHVAWRACLELSSAALCARLRGIATVEEIWNITWHHLTSLDIS